MPPRAHQDRTDDIIQALTVIMFDDTRVCFNLPSLCHQLSATFTIICSLQHMIFLYAGSIVGTEQRL